MVYIKSVNFDKRQVRLGPKMELEECTHTAGTDFHL